MLYNSPEHGDQKELLRQVVERAVVNTGGRIRLELRAPFASLKDLTEEIRSVSRREGRRFEMKTGRTSPASFQEPCSIWLQLFWRPGLEPRMTDPESVVLPLNYLPST